MRFGFMAILCASTISLASISKEQFGGIGIQIDQKGSYWVITQVYPGTPAALAGLKICDTLISANGFDLTARNRDQALSYLRGNANTKLDLSVQNNGNRSYTLTRVAFQTASAQLQDLKLAPGTNALTIASQLLSPKALVFDGYGHLLSGQNNLSASSPVYAIQWESPISASAPTLTFPQNAPYQGYLFDAKGQLLETWQGVGNQLTLPNNPNAKYYLGQQGSYSIKGQVSF